MKKVLTGFMVFCGVVAAAVFVPEDSEYYNPILYPVKWTVKKLFVGETDILYTDFMRMTALENCSCDALKIEAPPVERYPSLKHELPTNGASVVSKLFGKAPPKSQFVEELRNLHRDIKELESGSDDELEIADQAGQNGKPPADKDEDWFDDAVENPCQAQFASLANSHLLKQNLIDSSCKKITEEIDAVEDWTNLDAEQLNAVRERLLFKLNALVYRCTLEEGGENYER